MTAFWVCFGVTVYGCLISEERKGKDYGHGASGRFPCRNICNVYFLDSSPFGRVYNVNC